MKSVHQKRVEELMHKAGQVVPSKPMIPDQKVRELRATLAWVECVEKISALGFQLQVSSIKENTVDLIPCGEPDLVKIVDGCVGQIVIATGTLSACGVQDLKYIKEVDENNLKKFGLGGYGREDGKWIEPPDHKPLRIKELLEKDGYTNSKSVSDVLAVAKELSK